MLIFKNFCGGMPSTPPRKHILYFTKCALHSVQSLLSSLVKIYKSDPDVRLVASYNETRGCTPPGHFVILAKLDVFLFNCRFDYV